MNRVQRHLEKQLKKRWSGSKGKFPYKLIEVWDTEGENKIEVKLKKRLSVGDQFTIDGVTYSVEETDWFEDQGSGTALVRMIRYRIPDTATTHVHKCPAKKEHIQQLSSDDVVKLENKHGAKKVKKYMRSPNIKMRTHSTLETKCPGCGVVFWKKNIALPDTVEVEKVMDEERGDENDG